MRLYRDRSWNLNYREETFIFLWLQKLLLPRFFLCYSFIACLPRHLNYSKMEWMLGMDILLSRRFARWMMSSGVKNLIQYFYQPVTTSQGSIKSCHSVSPESLSPKELIFTFIPFNIGQFSPLCFWLAFSFLLYFPQILSNRLALSTISEIIKIISFLQKHSLPNKFISNIWTPHFFSLCKLFLFKVK